MVPMQVFTILPVSSMHFRIIYRNLQCVDIQCISSSEVSVRDGSYSVFDTSRVNEGITPISGFQVCSLPLTQRRLCYIIMWLLTYIESFIH